MDIVNFDALKAQGKVLPADDVDLTEDYFIIGKRNVHYNTNSFKATEYPIYAIKAGDVMGANTKYKVYTALLTQSGITAPVATVLENTLGDITWSYSSVGEYTCNSSGLFTLGKTVNTIDQTVNISRYGDGIYTAYLYNINVNTLRFVIYDYPTLFNVDNCLLDKLIEIRVYN
jgi:hypothetical protein